MILPITLTMAAIAAFINFWLAMRIGRIRTSEKISVGDGGNPNLLARMRAQANFVEYTPFILILIGLIELATGTTLWLWIVGGIYMLGRVAHGIGMDGPTKARMIGTIITMITLIGLAIYAIAIPYITLSSPVVTELNVTG